MTSSARADKVRQVYSVLWQREVLTENGGTLCRAILSLFGRDFIGIELDKEYFQIAKDRIEKD